MPEELTHNIFYQECYSVSAVRNRISGNYEYTALSGKLRRQYTGQAYERSPELETVYYDCGSFIICRTEHFKNNWKTSTAFCRRGEPAGKETIR